MFIYNWLNTFGKNLLLMGRVFSRPERMRMFFKKYVKEMLALGVDSIGIVLLISFFIGAVICIQMKINIESPWMPRWVAGYTTREIMLLEFSSSIMCYFSGDCFFFICSFYFCLTFFSFPLSMFYWTCHWPALKWFRYFPNSFL